MLLNIGAGDWRPDGYTTLDIEDAEIRRNIADLPWPIERESCDGILASHILEHVDRAMADRVLAECVRILRPGGTLAIAVPDLDTFVECWRSGDFSPLGGYPWTNLNAFMGGGMAEPRAHWRHQYPWCFGSLAWACQEAGLVARRVPFDGSRLGAVHNPAYRAISVYVDGVKP